MMPPLKTHFEVVIPFLTEESANMAALIISNDGALGVEVREVAE